MIFSFLYQRSRIFIQMILQSVLFFVLFPPSFPPPYPSPPPPIEVAGMKCQVLSRQSNFDIRLIPWFVSIAIFSLNIIYWMHK